MVVPGWRAGRVSLLLVAFSGVICVIASTPPGPPPSSPITAAVTRAGGAKFAAVLKALNVTSPSDPSKINGALLVPSDAAITAWLREMGLSDSDLMARPQLLDLVASYHFVPYWNASAIPAAGRGSVKAFTADPNYILRVRKDSAGRTILQDVQNNTATAGTPTRLGNLTLLPIDRVLMSGGYFTTPAAALAYYPVWSTARGLVSQHGTELLPKDAAVTLFVPSNKAFADVSTTLRGASPAAARAVLSHHVTPGLVVLPRPRGAPASLQSGLAGQSLNMSVRPTRINTPWDKNPVPVEAAVVTSAGGKTANVRIYDIYAGKSVLHGVDSVLLPAAPGAGSGSTKPAATTGMPGTRGRRLAGHQSWVGTDEPSMSQAESSVPGFYQDGAGEGGGRSDGAGEAHGKGRRRLSQDWVGTDEPSFNDAEMGYYQGYPSILRQANINAALTTASQGSADNFGAGYDPYMAPQTGAGFMNGYW